MAVVEKQNHVLRETTCVSLLQKLQQIWDEVGVSDEERDQLLLQLEQECLDLYKRKVDEAAISQTQLLQELADAKIELCNLLSALGEKSGVGIPDKSSGTIKEQLAAIAPALEHLLKQREERVKEFLDVQSQIEKIYGEILENTGNMGSPSVDESDLSLKKLEGFQSQLRELQREKRDRLHKVLEFVSNIHDLCAVLGMDFFSTITEVHSTLNDTMESKSISNNTLSRLSKTVLALKGEKKQRLQKLQDLAMHLVDLWNLMEHLKKIGFCLTM